MDRRRCLCESTVVYGKRGGQRVEVSCADLRNYMYESATTDSGQASLFIL